MEVAWVVSQRFFDRRACSTEFSKSAFLWRFFRSSTLSGYWPNSKWKARLASTVDSKYEAVTRSYFRPLLELIKPGFLHKERHCISRAAIDPHKIEACGKWIV